MQGAGRTHPLYPHRGAGPVGAYIRSCGLLPFRDFVAAGPSGTGLGELPPPADLPTLPTFTPTGGSATALDGLADAAFSHGGTQGPQLPAGTSRAGLRAADAAAQLHAPGPFNPAAALPPKVVRKILALEFVEMSELRADVWPEDPTPADTPNTSRRAGRLPVISIKTWLECFARLAAVLVFRFPEKGPELWAYQSTILNAAHSYEGATWVAYDRQFRREMLARKDLNWCIPNSRLYNEAFTGRAKMMQRCQYCLSEDHGSTGCPQHPNPMILGWFQPPAALPQPSALTSVAPSLPSTSARPPGTEVCRNFNAGLCNFGRCRYSHVCSDCAGPHNALSCPRRTAALGPPRNRPPQRARGNPGGRGNQFHPYAPPPQHPGPSTS